MRVPRLSLAWQILIALALGIVVGSVLHGVAPESREWLITNILTPAGQIFIRLIKRSEEHTSELQSLMRISYAVFCLKKKKNIKLKQLITRRTSINDNK